MFLSKNNVRIDIRNAFRLPGILSKRSSVYLQKVPKNYASERGVAVDTKNNGGSLTRIVAGIYRLERNL